MPVPTEPGNETIVIYPEETLPASSQTRDLLIGPNKNIRVVLGMPTKEVDGQIKIENPNNPHVFKVKRLVAIEDGHQPQSIEDITVILGHGSQVEDRWEFADGQRIVETVEAYNQYARENHQSPIEFVLSCNDEVSNPEMKGIKIGEFDERQNIAYVVGEKLSIDTFPFIDDNEKMTIIIQAKKFWGLENLILSRQIKLL